MRESLLEKLQEAEACARCEHEKRLGIEQQRDELLAALKEVVALSDRKHDAWDVARAVIAKVEGEE